jgi:hypothetical protein
VVALPIVVVQADPVVVEEKVIFLAEEFILEIKVATL